MKKSTNAATPYVPYNKTEQLKNRIGIWFLSKENPDLYRNYFTCDYNKLESISSNGYRTELRVKNAVACNGSHNWAKAADCGWSDIEMYASMYDKECIVSWPLYDEMAEIEEQGIDSVGYFLKNPNAPENKDRVFTVYYKPVDNN